MSTDPVVGRHHATKHLGTERQCIAETKTGARCTLHVCVLQAGESKVYATRCPKHIHVSERNGLKRKLQKAKLARYTRNIGTPVEVAPADALLQQVWEAAGNVAYLRDRIQALKTPIVVDPMKIHPDQLLEGDEVVETEESDAAREIRELEFDADRRVSLDPEDDDISGPRENLIESYVTGPIGVSIYGPDHLGNLSPHVLFKMYNDERDRLVRFVKIAIECGLAERQQKLAEDQSRLIASVVLSVLQHDSMDLSMDKQFRGRQIAAEVMREYNAALEGRIRELGA